MTFTPANDLPVPPSRLPCLIDMSVLELGAFARAYRSNKPSTPDEIALTLSQWFRCDLRGADIASVLVAIVARGWLATHATGFRATTAGHRHARSHLHGVVQMLDQGTKVLDAAVMLSMLGIARADLDGEHDDENLDDRSERGGSRDAQDDEDRADAGFGDRRAGSGCRANLGRRRA